MPAVTSSATRLSFNSNLVRLSAAFPAFQFPCRSCFNSNLVRLSGADAGERVGALVSFNSNLVRLSGLGQEVGAGHTVFQFQSGAIKRKIYDIEHNAIHLFQFQSGAIKRCGRAQGAW